MARKPRDHNVVELKPKKGKSGKPKALEEEERKAQEAHQTPEEFAKEFFGDGAKSEPQEGLPSAAWLKEHYKTKSAAIRYLHSGLWHPEGKGATPLQISKHLGIRYQHARNVCTTHLKRGPNEDWRPKETLPNAPKDDNTGGDSN
jgi:hypothetical protein